MPVLSLIAFSKSFKCVLFVVPISFILQLAFVITSGILKEPPISTNSPLLIITSFSFANVFNVNNTAAALLLTIIEDSEERIEFNKYEI